MIGATSATRGEAGRQSSAGKCRLSVFREPRFGKAHQCDHALIGLPRIGAEAENPVLHEDQTFDAGIGIEHLAPPPSPTQSPASDTAHSRRARRTLRGTEHRRRAGRSSASTAVEWVWSMNLCGMKACSSASTDGLGDAGSIRFARCSAHHLLVGKAFAGAQFQQRREPHRRQAGGLDRAHVPAGALDAEHLDIVAVEIGDVASSPRCCRRHAAPAADPDPAAASYRHARPRRGRVFRSGPTAASASRSIQALCIGFFLGYSAAAAVRSGKAAASAARFALSTPRSVISPVTSRAGVTSNP